MSAHLYISAAKVHMVASSCDRSDYLFQM